MPTEPVLANVEPLMDVDLARLLKQHAESWQRAGIKDLPRVSVDLSAAAADATAPSPPEAAATGRIVQAEPAPEHASSRETSPSEMASPPVPKKKVSAAASAEERPIIGGESYQRAAEAGVALRAALPDDRASALAILKEQVAACTSCEELARTRTQTVFGVGDIHTKIVFCGEAPGADEDRQGEPFVGRAGQLLNDIIVKGLQMRREDLYILNVLKCRPPDNRPPEPLECINCRKYLVAQLRILDPEYIICWGTHAAQNVLGLTLPIGRLRGRFYQFGNAKVLCTYHPSYLLRNPPAKKDVWEDLKIFLADRAARKSAH